MDIFRQGRRNLGKEKMITYNSVSLNIGGSTLIPKNTVSPNDSWFKPYPNSGVGFQMKWWDIYANEGSGPVEQFTSASYVTNGVDKWSLSDDGVVSSTLPTGYEYKVHFDYNDRLKIIDHWRPHRFSAYYTITNWDWVKEMKVMDCNYCSGVYYQLPNCTDLEPHFIHTDNLVSFGGDYPDITGKLEPVITTLTSLGVSADNSEVRTHNSYTSGAPFRNSTGAQDYAHCVTAYPAWFN
jgi:hypothetical protein